MSGNFFNGRCSKYSRYKKNAMSPLTILASILGTVFFYGVVASNSIWVNLFSGLLVSIIIAYYIRAYEYHLQNNPDRLQTEGWNLENKALNYLLPESKENSTVELEGSNEGTIEVTPSPKNIRQKS